MDFKKAYMLPKGVLLYCRYDEAEDFKDAEKFGTDEEGKPKGDGKFAYSSKVIYREGAAEKVQHMCDTAIAAKFENRTNESMPFPMYKWDEDEEGKYLVINTKIKERGGNETKNWDNRPHFFDNEGTPIEPVKLGNGTIAQVKVVFDHYPGMGGGISLRPKEVYIHELVEYTGERTEEEKAAYRKQQLESGESDELPF